MNRSVTGEKDSGGEGQWRGEEMGVRWGCMCHADTWCSRWQLCSQMDLVTCVHIRKNAHTCMLTCILYTYSQLLPLCLNQSSSKEMWTQRLLVMVNRLKTPHGMNLPTALFTTCHFPACGAITPPKSLPVLATLKGKDIQVWISFVPSSVILRFVCKV